MKTLEKARKDLEKAMEKRDQTRARLEADEYVVKECEAALTESENNEYSSEIRAWGLSVEEVKALRKALEKRSIAEVLAAMKEDESNDEFSERAE